MYQSKRVKPFFLFGNGSNQHNQLLLLQSSSTSNPNNHDKHNAALLINDGEDAIERKEIVVPTIVTSETEDTSSSQDDDDKIKELFAGGGHSGLLTESGKLYLWGWNENSQLGPTTTSTLVSPKEDEGTDDDNDDYEASKQVVAPSITAFHPLPNIQVETAALGFSHTLVIEKATGRLFGFGSNDRGQVTAGDDGDGTSTATNIVTPTTPSILHGVPVSSVAAGLFHSAAITADNGELVTFGCGRFGQSLASSYDNNRWKPNDGSKLVDVACGRRHTAVVDEKGRVWTFGENKYGQLGRAAVIVDDDNNNKNTKSSSKKKTLVDSVPRQVDGLEKLLPNTKITDYKLSCGWSHTILTVKTEDSRLLVYGWGRNDKGQLGITPPAGDGNANGVVSAIVTTPRLLFEDKTDIVNVVCGSESTIVLDKSGNIYGCGWNEHGNLSIGSNEDTVFELTKATGAPIVAPPSRSSSTTTMSNHADATGNIGKSSTVQSDILMAAGGAHFIAALRH